MRKAAIYFNGSVVNFVKFEKIVKTEQNTCLIVGYGDDEKTVAIIPITHLIIIE